MTIKICEGIINNQEAELDKHKKHLNRNIVVVGSRGCGKSLYQKNQIEFWIDNIKAEAIKEFAERLKNIYIKDKRYDRPNAHTLIDWLFANIDNLVKEMVGDTE